MNNRIQEMALRIVDAGLTPMIEGDGALLCTYRGLEEKLLSINVEAMMSFPEGFYQKLLEVIDELGTGRKEGVGQFDGAAERSIGA
jgi:hypothetical protein